MADAFPAVRTWVFEEIHESTHHNDDSDRFTALRNAMEGDASVALVHKHKSGALASRPAAGNAGRVYVATDGGAERAFFDDGTVWWEAPLLDSTPAQGDLPYFDGDKYALLPLGSAFQGLRVNAAADGFEWADDPPIRKVADETVNNSAALQDDDELLFAIGANEVWLMELAAFINEADATPGFDWAFTGPAGTVNTVALMALYNADGTIVQGAIPLLTGFGASLAVDTSVLSVKGIVRNGATAGTIQFKWAQQVAHASNTKVLLDSWLARRRVA